MNDTADIIERLRALGREYWQHKRYYDEAADEIERLRAALEEINNWLVCAPIATAEDMAQSFPRRQQVAETALGEHQR